MVCQLQNDPKIRDNYQFFFYRYSSGNSILASAAEFRDLLEQMREELCQDEKMKDKFNHLVLIGHSMGGLICKTMILKNEAEFLE